MQIFGKKDTVEKPVVITPWSLIHFCSGLTASKYVHFWTGQIGHGIYEVIGSKRVFEKFGYPVKEHSSTINSFGDQGCFTLGHILNIKGPWEWVTIGLFMLFTSRKVEF